MSGELKNPAGAKLGGRLLDLERERASLQAENERLREETMNKTDQLIVMRDDLKTLRAENERLRAERDDQLGKKRRLSERHGELVAAAQLTRDRLREFAENLEYPEDGWLRELADDLGRRYQG